MKMGNKKSLQPIGIFDSGIGGLTVVKEIINILPNEDIVYLGDTARVPYGNKSKDTIIKYSIQNTKFLLKHKIKLLVVACNTSSGIYAGIKRYYENGK
jgi:glutamate racemase